MTALDHAQHFADPHLSYNALAVLSTNSAGSDPDAVRAWIKEFPESSLKDKCTQTPRGSDRSGGGVH